eukprot:CAMPEP_0181348874 /NCGR_PEP_ID=MMETSP1106-20121128/421_1 /TAXON_ID=81844 /ORGANISM="Mantoniella antarctica, Strain SL-175" /LENGTH=42 /DNA_ID= /DNA_START= /DNA_END= /DNA_ORIENTATION=
MTYSDAVLHSSNVATVPKSQEPAPFGAKCQFAWMALYPVQTI